MMTCFSRTIQTRNEGFIVVSLLTTYDASAQRILHFSRFDSGDAVSRLGNSGQ
jgi:hypothetical protein